MEGGAEGSLGGGGAAALGGQGKAAEIAGGWRNTLGMCMGLGGGLSDKKDGAWGEGVDRGACEG